MSLTKTSMLFKKIYFRFMVFFFYRYHVGFPEVRAEEALTKYEEMYNWLNEHSFNNKKYVSMYVQENFYGCLMTGGLMYPTANTEKRIKLDFYFANKDVASFFKLTFQ